MYNSYLFPCNPTKYDVLSSFIKNGFVDFSTYQSMQIGDIVYLYISAPYSALLFKCQVKSVLGSDDTINDNEFSKVEFDRKNKYVRLVPIRSYLDIKDKVCKDVLQFKGVKGFNIQLKLSKDIVDYLEEI